MYQNGSPPPPPFPGTPYEPGGGYIVPPVLVKPKLKGARPTTGIAGPSPVAPAPATPKTPTEAPSAAPADDYGKGAYDSALAAIGPSPTLEQTQYQPPKKGDEIIGGILSVLFPGSPIATAAAGYLGGLQNKSESTYERAQQADQAKYAAEEQKHADEMAAAQQAGQVMDRRLAIHEQEENSKLRAEQAAEAEATRRAAEESQAAYRKAQEAHEKRQDALKWNHDQATIAHWADQDKNAEFRSQTGRLNYDLGVKRLDQTFALGIRNGNIRLENARQARAMTYLMTQMRDSAADSRALVHENGVTKRFNQTLEFQEAKQKLEPLEFRVKKALADASKAGPDDQGAQQNVDKAIADFNAARDQYLPKLSAVNPQISKASTEADTLFPAVEEYVPQEYGVAGSDTSQPYGQQPYGQQTPAPSTLSGAAQGEPGGHRDIDSTNFDSTGAAPQPVQTPLGTWTPPPGVVPPDPRVIGNYQRLLLKNGAPPDLALKLSVAGYYESGNQVNPPLRQNPNGTYDYGLFQINSNHKQFDPNKLRTDPDYNAKAALTLAKEDIARGGDGTQPWNSSKHNWGGTFTPLQAQSQKVDKNGFFVGDAANQAPPPVTSNPPQGLTPQVAEAYQKATHEQREEALKLLPPDIGKYLQHAFPAPPSVASAPNSGGGGWGTGDFGSPKTPVQRRPANAPGVDLRLPPLQVASDDSPSVQNPNLHRSAPAGPNPLAQMAAQGLRNTLSTPPNAQLEPQPIIAAAPTPHHSSQYLQSVAARVRAMAPAQRPAFLQKLPNIVRQQVTAILAGQPQ